MRSATADNAPMMLEAAESPVPGVFGRMFDLLIAIAENNGQYKKLSALSALSDDDLSRMGLRREDAIRQIIPGFGVY